MELFRHRVITTTSPRMATKNTPTCQIKTFEGPMLLDGIDGIAGACGGKTTRWWKQRRNACPIEIDGEKKYV
jgi:hypothetical protein